jgi:2-keto-3-deoxy-L-rhamnonate aldolase RhmA
MSEIILHQATCDPQMMQSYLRAGWRRVLIDMEHGFFTESDVMQALLALASDGAALYVKMTDLTPQRYTRLYRMGVRKFLMPHVEDPQSVRLIYDAMQEIFWIDHAALELYPLLESGAALEKIPEFCSLAGVAGVMLGPGDLCHDLGFAIRDMAEFQAAGPKIVPHLTKALQDIRNHGKRGGSMVLKGWFDTFPFELTDFVTLYLGDLIAAGDIASTLAARQPAKNPTAP